MATMRVILETPVPDEISSVMDLLDSGDREAVLTTEHAASSRGAPVVVLPDGTALGTAEVGGSVHVPTYMGTDDEIGRDIHRRLTDEERALVSAARAAGYDVTVTDGDDRG